MNRTIVRTALQLSVAASLFTACKKDADVIKPPVPPVQQPGTGQLAIRLKAAITIGDVLYDSIPAKFTITTWDANNVATQKDTVLDAGAQVIYLPKAATRYHLKMEKWGAAYEQALNKDEITPGALYQLGGQKAARKVKWVTEERVENGSFMVYAKQNFLYNAEGRIEEVVKYAKNPNTGELGSGGSDLYLYGGNELWVNYTNKEGIAIDHAAYTFDAQGRTIQTKYEYLTERHVYTNQYTNDGILMVAGSNVTNTNGSRITLKFTGGNRVEEKTIIPNYPTTIKNYTYDFNINPFAVVKVPSLYFEHSSRNNVVAEHWEGKDQMINEYKYDAEGYVTEVITKTRTNSGQFANFSRTTYTY